MLNSMKIHVRTQGVVLILAVNCHLLLSCKNMDGGQEAAPIKKYDALVEAQKGASQLFDLYSITDENERKKQTKNWHNPSLTYWQAAASNVKASVEAQEYAKHALKATEEAREMYDVWTKKDHTLFNSARDEHLAYAASGIFREAIKGIVAISPAAKQLKPKIDNSCGLLFGSCSLNSIECNNELFLDGFSYVLKAFETVQGQSSTSYTIAKEAYKAAQQGAAITENRKRNDAVNRKEAIPYYAKAYALLVNALKELHKKL